MKNLISVSLIILSLHLFTSAHLHCQSSALVDSLHRQLRLHPQSDSVRWNLLYALARNYRQTNPDSGIFYSSAAYELAQQLQDDVFIFKSYNVLGVSYTIRNREDQGLAWFLKALELAKSHAGDAWRKMQAQALINIAGLFYAQQQFEKALPYAKAAESILILLNEPQVLADDYQSLGLMYSNLTKLDSALLYFSKALAIYENLGNRQQQGRVLREIGNLQYKQEHYQTALDYMQKALILAYQTEDIVILPMTNNEIAKLYIQIGDYSKALNALYEALRLSKMEHDGDIREQSVTHQLLADSYVRQHRFDSAYVHLKAYYELREELLDKEKSERINELEIAYQSQQKELENTQLRDHNRTIYNQYLLLFTTSVVLLAGILAALMYSYRLRQQKKVIARQKQAVEQLAAELTQSQEHLTTILQEKSHLTSLITHDIQTPLSVIKFTASSILAENPTEALQADVKTINRAAEQIRYLSQRISDVQKIEAPDILPKLAPVNLVAIARETAPFYIQWGEKKHVQLIEQIEVPEVMVITDAFLLSKAIGNLLGNAVKFSTQGQCVYIRITKLHECGQIEIQDEGPGMSEEDQQKAFHKFQKLSAQPTSGEPSTGNGLYLAKRYVEAMNGIILLQSTLGKGSTFTIRLPLVKD